MHISPRFRLSLAAVVFCLCASTAVAGKSGEAPVTLGGSPGNDLTCVPEPDAPAGHFVCEDPDSFARCQALQGKGAVLVEGEKKPVPVVECRQGG